MYNPRNIKIASVIAIIVSSICFLLSLIFMNEVNGTNIISAVSWGILIWASILGYKLSSYNLYEEEYKKVAIRVYLIIFLFIIFILVGIVIGAVLSIILLSSLWSLKRNYDEWEN